ncbi:mitochondrial ribosomal protein L37-domain-containing protein [Infundibulicybe gibba]|nr:mitochondrial ribosomal protein L37-domain-containing protein [Infundibulicybe gibba]KAF8891412.1 mitochondrial ribosomal protein L37-domain-containing protein [Infundibulicybe gibba]
MSLLQRSLRRGPPSFICRTRGYASKSSPSTNEAKPAKKGSTPLDAAAPQSSCAPDTVLTGVNYLKGQAPVLALPDDSYPDWLWTILKPKVWPDDGPGGKAERVARRNENRRQIKDRNFMQTQ